MGWTALREQRRPAPLPRDHGVCLAAPARPFGRLFAAGHGTTDARGKFWFLTYDMDPDDGSATAVSRDDISDVLFDLPGKKRLFLDIYRSRR